MQQNRNLLILLLFLFSFSGLKAQPDPKRKIYDLKILLKSCNKELLNFESENDIIFYTKNKKNKVFFEIVYKNPEKTENEIVKLNKSSLKDGVYDIKYKNQKFLIKHNYITTYNEVPINKSVLKITFEKKKKRMTIFLDFTSNKIDLNLNDIVINFKEGEFLVNDETMKIKELK